MTKTGSLITLAVLLMSNVALGGETITATAQGVEGYFYVSGKMKSSKDRFEITYYIEGDTVTRTRVYDLNKKTVTPDNTVYKIQRQLSSDPTGGTSKVAMSVIRAIGQPGKDAIEILVISKTFIQSVISTSDYFVISGYRRIR